MANNNITLRTEMVPILDEIYKVASKSAVLDSEPDLVNLEAGDFKIPIMEMDGLASHNRANGGRYVDGGAYLRWQLKSPTYDRNRKFTIDVMDNVETSDVAFGRLSGEFIRTQVVPEIDALRFAKYSQQALTTVIGTLSTATLYITALIDAKTVLDEKEVPEEDRHVFITPTVYNQMLNLGTTDARSVLDAYTFHTVPQSRFYTSIDLNDGVTSGQESGGWKKSASAYDINFLIVHRGAVIQGLKHEAPKYIPAAINQEADGDGYAYRVKGIEEVYENKKAGIYAHVKGTAAASVKLTFSAVGAKFVPAAITLVADGYVAKPQIDPFKEGKTFTGWYTAASSGTAVEFPLEVKQDTTIYAVFS